MANFCAKCKKLLKNTHFIQCTGLCKKCFHCKCVNIKNLKKLSANDVKRWVCSDCEKPAIFHSANENIPGTLNDNCENPMEITDESHLSLELYKEIEQIKQRQTELKILIQAEKLAKESSESYFEEDLEEKLKNLAGEHCKVVEAAAVQDIIIPNLQFSDALSKIFYNSLNDEDSKDNEFVDLLTKDDYKILTDALEELTQLSCDVSQLKNEVASVEDETRELQLKIQHISAEKYLLMKKLQDLEENKQKKKHQPVKEPSLKMESLQKEEKKLMRMLNIKNYILQKIIAFSGLNWAQDEELKAIVFDTGKPLDLQLSEMSAK